MTEPRNRRHPLTRAFPLSVMTLAAFLVAFAILMARMQAGVDPALRAASASPAALARQLSTSTAVVTRSSRAAPLPSSSRPPGRGQATRLALVTRASGRASGEGGDDA